jgi:signal transduction histidine kinase
VRPVVYGYLFYAAAVVRDALTYSGTRRAWWLAGLMLVFLLLYSVESRFFRRSPWQTHIYLVVQSALILAMLDVRPFLDVHVILFVALTLQAFDVFPRRTAFAWLGIFTLVMLAGLARNYGPAESLFYVSTYFAGCLVVGLYVLGIRRVEAAREESQALLAELQAAHRQLQAYAGQVEELAAAEERNRLARELHDSVTQTIFSLTLTAQAARMLLDQDTARAAQQLDRVQELAGDALAEMRSLIRQLRPKTVAELGLAPALRQHAAERQSRDGLHVDLHVDGERRLPAETEEALFRVVQEALNNVVKHARTDRAEVCLAWQAQAVTLTVEDRGAGFDSAGAGPDASHLGLTSMHERVKALGGTLDVRSEPGAGTCIHVHVPLIEKEDRINKDFQD